jgi:hypothetical protein
MIFSTVPLRFLGLDMPGIPVLGFIFMAFGTLRSTHHPIAGLTVETGFIVGGHQVVYLASTFSAIGVIKTSVPVGL